MLKALRQIKHKYWISAGTALGLYRDGDFIPSDTDLDIEILVPEGQDIRIDELTGFAPYRFVDHQGKAMQRAFIDNMNHVVFDIYFMHDGIKDGHLWNWCDYGEYALPKQYVEQLMPIKTKYGELPMPHPIEQYLVFRYGKDWRIPSNKKGLYTKEW